MMLLAEVYERAPATVHIHTESDGDDPRMEARGAPLSRPGWESPGEDARALVGRKTFGTMAADLARNLRAMVDDPASPGTWDAASSEIPRFMREVLERPRPSHRRAAVGG